MVDQYEHPSTYTPVLSMDHFNIIPSKALGIHANHLSPITIFKILPPQDLINFTDVDTCSLQS